MGGSPGHSLQPTDPGHRGSAPDLPPRLDLVALADTAPANPPVVRAALAAGEKRRTAFRAEMLEARPAVIAGLGVDLRQLPRHPDLVAPAARRHPARLSS